MLRCFSSKWILDWFCLLHLAALIRKRQVVVAVDQTAVLGSHLAVAVGQMVGFGQVAFVVAGKLLTLETTLLRLLLLYFVPNHLVGCWPNGLILNQFVVIDQTVVLETTLLWLLAKLLSGNRLVAVAFHSSSLDCRLLTKLLTLEVLLTKLLTVNSQPFQA